MSLIELFHGSGAIVPPSPQRPPRAGALDRAFTGGIDGEKRSDSEGQLTELQAAIDALESIDIQAMIDDAIGAQPTEVLDTCDGSVTVVTPS